MIYRLIYFASGTVLEIVGFMAWRIHDHITAGIDFVIGTAAIFYYISLTLNRD